MVFSVSKIVGRTFRECHVFQVKRSDVQAWIGMAVTMLIGWSGPILAQEQPATSEDPAPRKLPGWLQFSQLPPVPDSVGFAGMYAGVSHDVMIAAGGANFPEAPPWEGGGKVWYDRIYLLESAEGELRWRQIEQRLPRRSAYGVSVSYGDRVICVGGCNADRFHSEVIALEYLNGEVRVESLPKLPGKCAFMSGAVVEDTLYIAGGIDRPEDQTTTARHTFWKLDLSRPAGEMEWETLEPWPGAARMLSVSAAQDGRFYLFSGVRLTEGEEPSAGRRVTPYLKDAYAFTPGKGEGGEWERLPDMPFAAAAAPSPAPALGQSHVAILGGADGSMLNLDPAGHPGFSDRVMGYNAVTKSWTPNAGTMRAGASKVTAPVTAWQDGWAIVSGEIRPGVRSPEVQRVRAAATKVAFGAVNWIVLGAYLAGMVVMGFYFSRREQGTEDFFLAGRRIPWWASGLSIYGTQLSAITFMAIPAIGYASDWRRLLANMMIFVVAPLVVLFYLPFYRRLNVSTAYEFLERRFHLSIRLLCSLMFILFQFGRIGIVLFLPSIALAAVTGMDVYLCIAVMGILATIYTALGGIEAVIWTDVIQVMVLLGGALLCVVLILVDVGGIGPVFNLGSAADKFHVLDWSWDISGFGVWVMIVGPFFINLGTYTTDQTVIQRYLTTKDEKQAARGIWTNAILSIPTGVLFFFLGTSLFIFYKLNPEFSIPGKNDQILPMFIVQQLPAGVSGLVIAGIFAASMSSLDSSMNSVATAYVTDFHRRLNPGVSDRHCLKLARWITVILGAIGMTMAMLMAGLEIKFIFDLFNNVIGLFGGALAGVFVLGIFVRRANWVGALAGFVAGALVPGLLLLEATFVGRWNVNGWLFGAFGTVSCIVVGWVVSGVTIDKQET